MPTSPVAISLASQAFTNTAPVEKSQSSSAFTNTAPIAVSDVGSSLGHYTQLLTLTANPSNGETVTINGKVYTFQSSLTNTDGNVKIGVSAGVTLANLAGAMNLTTVGLGSGPGTGYAAAMTLHSTVRAYEPTAGSGSTLTVYAMATGSTGAYAVSETLSNGSWGAAALSSVSLYYPTPVEISQASAAFTNTAPVEISQASTAFTNTAPVEKSQASSAFTNTAPIEKAQSGSRVTVGLATTANLSDLTGILSPIDGVTITDGMLALLKDQTSPAENGLYVLVDNGDSSFSATRIPAYDTAAELTTGLQVLVSAGTVNRNKVFYLHAAPATLGVSSIVFNDFAPIAITIT